MSTRKIYFTTLLAGQTIFALIFLIPLWHNTTTARMMNSTFPVTLATLTMLAPTILGAITGKTSPVFSAWLYGMLTIIGLMGVALLLDGWRTLTIINNPSLWVVAVLWLVVFLSVHHMDASDVNQTDLERMSLEHPELKD